MSEKSLDLSDGDEVGITITIFLVVTQDFYVFVSIDSVGEPNNQTPILVATSVG